jgi:hypothetical protein
MPSKKRLMSPEEWFKDAAEQGAIFDDEFTGTDAEFDKLIGEAAHQILNEGHAVRVSHTAFDAYLRGAWVELQIELHHRTGGRGL